LILGIGYGPSGDVGYSVDCGERAKLQALEKSDDVKRVLYEPSTPMGTLRFFVFIITHTLRSFHYALRWPKSQHAKPSL